MTTSADGAAAVGTPRFVSPKQASEMLGGVISPHGVYKALQEGRLRGSQPSGWHGRWIIETSDLFEWLEHGRHRGVDRADTEAPTGGGDAVEQAQPHA